jgi:iron complex outermembrane receptor protein
MRPPRPRTAIVALCAAVLPLVAAHAQTEGTVETPTVEVIGTTPLPGIGLPIDQIPSNVQAVTESEIDVRQAINVTDFISRTLPSANVNDATGNPYQSELFYRGFIVSPLLGQPQGLSVYQDGVRLNEPFGDVVYWDLIPPNAIEAMDLIPGSNPVFGLNTLGGALSIRTKDGAAYPNTGVQVQGGSWGRWVIDAEHGGHTETKDYYISASYFEEDGWRDFSPSEVTQIFAKFGHKDALNAFSLGITYGDTDLTGNGVTPESMLEQRREQVFTVPDNTTKEMWMLNLTGSRVLDDRFQLGGNVYYRTNKIKTLNGDNNDDYEDCFETLPTPAVDCTELAVSNRTRTDEDGYGAALQLSHVTLTNHVTVGVSADRGESEFSQTATGGVFDGKRGVVETEDEELENELEGTTTTYSIYLTDTWSFTPRTHVTASARFNRTEVETRDQLGTALNGDHTFNSLNPAIGVAHSLERGMTLFGGWSQGSRAPSPIELGCSDPNNPCTLPNALQADPPLDQVISRTWELGARGRLFGSTDWVVSGFWTDNRDDILFISTGTSAGYFDNVAETRRQGLELGLTGTVGKWGWKANYSYIRATFQSDACILSENNSSRGQSPDCAADDEIRVESGDTLPGVPEHQVKFALDYRATERLTLGVDISAFSDQYARGNENNRHQAGTFTDPVSGDTRTFLGSGKVSDYAVLNLTGRYRVARNWEVFARIDNVFDSDYETVAILAENPFNAAGQYQLDPDDWSRETFFAPGAPRAAWVGVRFNIDRTPRR